MCMHVFQGMLLLCMLLTVWRWVPPLLQSCVVFSSGIMKSGCTTQMLVNINSLCTIGWPVIYSDTACDCSSGSRHKGMNLKSDSFYHQFTWIMTMWGHIIKNSTLQKHMHLQWFYKRVETNGIKTYTWLYQFLIGLSFILLQNFNTSFWHFGI